MVSGRYLRRFGWDERRELCSFSDVKSEGIFGKVFVGAEVMKIDYFY